jgi:hypothetical protein
VSREGRERSEGENFPSGAAFAFFARHFEFVGLNESA